MMTKLFNFDGFFLTFKANYIVWLLKLKTFSTFLSGCHLMSIRLSQKDPSFLCYIVHKQENDNITDRYMYKETTGPLKELNAAIMLSCRTKQSHP